MCFLPATFTIKDLAMVPRAYQPDQKWTELLGYKVLFYRR